MDEALNIAKEVEQVVLMVGTNSDWETEGNDRVVLIFLVSKMNLLKKY